MNLIEKLELPKKRGGRREGSGRKVSIDLIKDKVRKEVTAEFWVNLAESKAIPLMLDLMDDPMTPPKTRFSAAQEIVNRAYGKPKESVQHSGDVNMTLTEIIRQARGGKE